MTCDQEVQKNTCPAESFSRKRQETEQMKQQILKMSCLTFVGTIFVVATISTTVMVTYWDGVLHFLLGTVEQVDLDQMSRIFSQPVL